MRPVGPEHGGPSKQRHSLSSSVHSVSPLRRAIVTATARPRQAATASAVSSPRMPSAWEETDALRQRISAWQYRYNEVR